MTKRIIDKSRCKNNRDLLIWLMTKHKITSEKVADMVHVQLATVRRWRCVNGKIPQRKLDLLTFKLECSDA